MENGEELNNLGLEIGNTEVNYIDEKPEIPEIKISNKESPNNDKIKIDLPDKEYIADFEKKFKTEDYKKELSKEDLKVLEKYLDIKFKREIASIKIGLMSTYLAFIIFISLIGATIISTFIFNIPTVWKFIIYILAVPSLIIIIIAMIMKLFLFGDFQRIRGKIIVKFSSNFIVANWFLTQHRTIKKVEFIMPDGKSFLEDNRLYMIDYSTIFLDEDKLPNSYYIPNIPNPLKFDFYKILRDALTHFKNGTIEDFNPDMDVLYSSENLTLMKKDKFLTEMHRDNREELNKMFMWFAIFAIIVFIGFVLYAIFGHPQPNIVVQVNSTMPPPKI